jgi:hypothetical protein
MSDFAHIGPKPTATPGNERARGHGLRAPWGCGAAENAALHNLIEETVR